MFKPALLITLLSVFLSHGGPALADVRTFTLKEALAVAMKGNHSLKASAGASGAVAEEIGIARSRLLPNIVFEERFTRTNNPTLAFASKLNQGRFTQDDFAIGSLNNPAAVNDYQTSFSVEQVLLSKKASVGLLMAERQYSASTEELGRKKEEVVYAIIRTHLTTKTARRFIATAEKGVDDAAEHLRLAELRYTSEIGLYSDVLRASLMVTTAKQRLATANKNLLLAERQMGLLLGLEEPATISDAVPELPVKDIGYYTRSALSRKDVRSMSLKYENAKSNIELASAAYYPTIGVGGAYMMNDHLTPLGSEGDSWQVSAQLRWSIFDGTLRRHESNRARHSAAEASEHLSGLKKAVSYRIYEAYLEAQEAARNTELTAGTLAVAEEGERLVRTRFENGLTPISDLLDAQMSLDEARTNHVMKENELKSAIAALHFESGTIIKDLGLE